MEKQEGRPQELQELQEPLELQESQETQEQKETQESQMWKKMYMRLLRGVEEATNILIQSGQDCEELYVSADHTNQEYSQINRDASGMERKLCMIYGKTTQLCRGHIIPPKSNDIENSSGK